MQTYRIRLGHSPGTLPTSRSVMTPSTRGWLRTTTKHPTVMPFYRLVALVVVCNIAVAAWGMVRYGWQIADGSVLGATSALAVVNVAVAVGVRQQPFLNLIYGLVGSGSNTWPLWARWSLSKIHHIGGVHAGAAIAATGWTCAFAVAAFVAHARHPGAVTTTVLILSSGLVALVTIITVCSAPIVRTRAHNLFELTHRWGGWSAVAIFWTLTLHLALHERGDHAIVAIGSEWRVWMLALITVWVAWPWLRLRRVPISVERPSSHVAIVAFDHVSFDHVLFDHGVQPTFSAAVGISRNPLREWHPFATITTPDRPGFRLVISRAGDWTSRFIDDPPSHVWIRGEPVVAPMAQAALLYRRVVYVATGSGIGPLLGQILADRVPGRLVWSTRSPRATYGDALVEEVAAAQPDAVIWDTTAQGKPDLTRLATNAVDDFDAEAVFVVSNKPTTRRLVHDLERQGIPAFGPIWDS